jgi:predicted metal-dependent enzyme (double-stranded beta helix superfamily)
MSVAPTFGGYAPAAPAPARIALDLARQGTWRNQVRLDRDRRTYSRIAETEDWEAWLLGWWPGQGTGIHDHGGAHGAFVVLRGVLVETAWSPQGITTERVLGQGKVRSFGGSLVHDVRNPGRDSAVSLHVYSPRLTSMTRYLEDLTPVGVERAEVDW